MCYIYSAICAIYICPKSRKAWTCNVHEGLFAVLNQCLWHEMLSFYRQTSSLFQQWNSELAQITMSCSWDVFYAYWYSWQGGNVSPVWCSRKEHEHSRKKAFLLFILWSTSNKKRLGVKMCWAGLTPVAGRVPQAWAALTSGSLVSSSTKPLVLYLQLLPSVKATFTGFQTTRDFRSA